MTNCPKKSVLFVTPFFAPAWAYGGPPHVMHDLATSLVSSGINVTCVTTNALDAHRTVDHFTSNQNGVLAYYFKNISNKLAWHFKFFTPIGMRHYLNNHVAKFDIVHIADFRNLCTVYAWQACQKENVPYVISPFGSIPNTKDFRGGIKYLFDTIFGKQCLKDARRITVQTNHEKEEAIRYGVPLEKICLVPLHIDYKKFAHLPSAGQFRHKYGISTEEKIILFVGRINQYKATDFMVHTFHQIIKKNVSARLVLVGRNDGYEKHLRNLVKKLDLDNKVLFTGPIYYPESMTAYVDANVFFIAPSHYEETSTASLEALACGCPIVVTKEAEVPYLNKSGVGFMTTSQQASVEALLELLSKRPVASACIQFIKDHFSIQSIKNKYICDIYNLK